MAWHSTWDSTDISNNEIKYLLSDLCCATNERIRYSLQTSIDFKIADGSTEPFPTAADFVGLPFSADGTGHDLGTVLNQIIGGISGMANRFYSGNRSAYSLSDDTGIIQFSFSTLCSTVGTDSSSANDIQNYRERDWWLKFREMLELMRYSSRTPSFTGMGQIYKSDPALNHTWLHEFTTPEDTWDSLAFDGTDFQAGNVGVYLHTTGADPFNWPYTQVDLIYEQRNWDNVRFEVCYSTAVSFTGNSALTYPIPVENSKMVALWEGVSSIYDPVNGVLWGASIPAYEVDFAGETLAITDSSGQVTIDPAPNGAFDIILEPIDDAPWYPNSNPENDQDFWRMNGQLLCPAFIIHSDFNSLYDYPA